MPDKILFDIATKYDIVEGAPNRQLESAILIMGAKKFRRLPITKLGRIRGILTVTDILRAIAAKGLPDAFSEEIADWMTVNPRTAPPDMTVKNATKIMSEGNFGSLLIVDDDSNILKGIVTERDILRHMKDTNWETKLSEIDRKFLTMGLVIVDESTSLVEVIKLMDKARTHRVIIAKNDVPTGILTANDIISLYSREREEISHNPNFLKSVNASFVGTNSLYSVDINTSISDTVKLMVDKNIGSTPVLEDGKIMGIFSERSLIHYIANTF